MEVEPRKPTSKGPDEWFTGDVWLDLIGQAKGSSPMTIAAVHFTPGARTAWHSHAVGQTLYVTDGRGFVQARGGEVTALRAGDVVHAPADEWHWHGAAAEHYMTHLSITEAPGDDRPETVWGEHVTDAEYPR